MERLLLRIDKKIISVKPLVVVGRMIVLPTHCSSCLALATAASESRREDLSSFLHEYWGGGRDGKTLIKAATNTEQPTS